MVLADATLMLLLIRPDAPVPGDAKGVTPDRVRERINYLINRLENDNIKIVVPTPVLSELLIRSKPRAAEIIEKLSKYAVFEICPLDTLAAIELAVIAKKEMGRKRPDDVTTYAKIKFDRQIIAIAKVKKVKTIHSDDGDIYAMAKRVGITVVRLRELPVPPPREGNAEQIGQGVLNFTPPEEGDADDVKSADPQA
jgi:predicted nucleic acid-binding protein